MFVGQATLCMVFWYNCPNSYIINLLSRIFSSVLVSSGFLSRSFHCFYSDVVTCPVCQPQGLLLNFLYFFTFLCINDMMSSTLMGTDIFFLSLKQSFLVVSLLLFCFEDRVWVCSPDWLRICDVDQPGLTWRPACLCLLGSGILCAIKPSWLQAFGDMVSLSFWSF